MYCMRKMGTKITASLERVFRLRWLSEDDTIFSERTASTFGNVVFCRSGVSALGRFVYLQHLLQGM